MVTECFLTCSWRFLISKKLEQLEIILEKKIPLGFRNMQEKLDFFSQTWHWQRYCSIIKGARDTFTTFKVTCCTYYISQSHKLFSQKATTATQWCMFLRISSLITIKCGGIFYESSVFARSYFPLCSFGTQMSKKIVRASSVDFPI